VKTFRPWLATVLNLSNDHLARHGTMEHYAAVKARIFMNQTAEDVAIVNLDDPYCKAMGDGLVARVVPFTQASKVDGGMGIEGDRIFWDNEPVADVGDIPLPGRHNRENALAALAMMRAGGFEWAGVLDGLRAFRGVEHRIEFVAEVGGVRYYNDSKSTNLDSLRVALDSFEAPVILLAGGRGKGGDYGELASLVREKVKLLVAYGEDAAAIESAYADVTQVKRAGSLTEAAETARHAAGSGDTVLLSPACASFDQFKNFEARGHAFKTWVAQQAEAVSA
jgi:UDP-N-acetylmuramoylalanine--D-glutamate ligase